MVTELTYCNINYKIFAFLNNFWSTETIPFAVQFIILYELPDLIYLTIKTHQFDVISKYCLQLYTKHIYEVTHNSAASSTMISNIT